MESVNDLPEQRDCPENGNSIKLSALRPWEQALLISQRYWLFGFIQQQPVEDELSQIYQDAGLSSLYQHYEKALIGLVSCVRENLQVHGLACDHIAAYEQALLLALRYFQRQQTRSAEAALASLFGSLGVRLVSRPLKALSQQLSPTPIALDEKALEIILNLKMAFAKQMTTRTPTYH